MAVVLMAREPVRETSNLVGWHIKELMARKRIPSQDRLAEMVTDAGYPISQPALSKIIGGRTEPSRGFSRALTIAVDMNEEELREWAGLFALGETSTRQLSKENYENIKAVREQVRRENGTDEETRDGGNGADGARNNRG